jgi:hypothetical protein
MCAGRRRPLKGGYNLYQCFAKHVTIQPVAKQLTSSDFAGILFSAERRPEEVRSDLLFSIRLRILKMSELTNQIERLRERVQKTMVRL